MKYCYNIRVLKFCQSKDSNTNIIGNISDAKKTCLRYWRITGSESNAISIFVENWHYLENIADETPTLIFYWRNIYQSDE